MEKPIMIRREEFTVNLARLINNSGLHPAIVQPIVEKANAELQELLRQQYMREKQEYEKALAEEGREEAPENVD